MATKKDTHDDKLINLLLKKIGPVDMDLVIGEMDAGGKHLIKLNDKRIEDGEALALKREAELLEQMKIFKILTETLRYQAQVRMFEQSKQAEDVYISGKFLLHAISTLEYLVRACKNPLLLSEQKPPPAPGRKGVNNSVDRN